MEYGEQLYQPPLRSLSIYRHFYSFHPYPQTWCGRAEKTQGHPYLWCRNKILLVLFSSKGAMYAYLSSFFLEFILFSPLAGSYLHPGAFSFMSLFSCQGLKWQSIWFQNTVADERTLKLSEFWMVSFFGFQWLIEWFILLAVPITPHVNTASEFLVLMKMPTRMASWSCNSGKYSKLITLIKIFLHRPCIQLLEILLFLHY